MVDSRLRQPPLPVIEEVTCFLRTPSYISCEWALNRHGILLQSPVVCTVLTLSTAVGSARDGFNLALPEKALLDTIYLRKAIPFVDELELSQLDRKRLDRMASDFPGPTRKLQQSIR